MGLVTADRRPGFEYRLDFVEALLEMPVGEAGLFAPPRVVALLCRVEDPAAVDGGLLHAVGYRHQHHARGAPLEV